MWWQPTERFVSGDLEFSDEDWHAGHQVLA